MSTLVIIGNGFDIWHGLPTSYFHFFRKYSKSLEKYTQYFKDLCNVDEEWQNFESSLGSFDIDDFLSNVSEIPSIDEMAESSRALYGYEDEISYIKDELINNITDSFNFWISTIDVKPTKKKIDLPISYQFINFNYTTTLQDVYKISHHNILHIHGNVTGKVIFGHGRNLPEYTFNDNEPWFDGPKKDAQLILEKFRKPVQDILSLHSSRLKSYKNITSIIVIGHSINDIDKPYFKFILKAYPNAEWKNYNHSDGILDTHRKLINIGVPKEKLTSKSTNDLKTIYPIKK